jgi:hypothetical protein
MTRALLILAACLSAAAVCAWYLIRGVREAVDQMAYMPPRLRVVK